jgi:hypothetical protein
MRQPGGGDVHPCGQEPLTVGCLVATVIVYVGTGVNVADIVVAVAAGAMRVVVAV